MAQQMLNDHTFTPAAIQAAGGVKTGSDRMSLMGVTIKSAILLIVTLVFGAVGWRNADRIFETANGMWFLIGFMVLIGLSIWATQNPKIAMVVGFVYAIFMGLYMGSISALYEELWDGVVPQAILATIGVFVVCLVLFHVGAVRVSPRFRRMVIAATLGVLVLYVTAWILTLFGADIYFWTNPNALGFIISGAIACIAALNLFLDFDFIEKGIEAGAPKSMEWFAAFGLLATLIWLYLQILQLLGMSRRA